MDSLQGSRDAEAEIDDASIAEVIGSAVRRAQAGGDRGPGTPAIHTRGAVDTVSAGGTFRWGTLVIVRQTVFHPLEGVSLHVVQPERIRLETPDRGREYKPVVTGDPVLPLSLRKTLRECGIDAVGVMTSVIRVISPVRRRIGSGTVGVLPLCFAEKPIRVAGLMAEPARIRLGFLPAHTHHGVSSGLWKTGVVPVQTHDGRPTRRFVDIAALRIGESGVTHERGVFIARDFISADGESVRNVDPVLRLFLILAVRITGRRSHEKASGADDHHLRADVRAVAKPVARCA